MKICTLSVCLIAIFITFIHGEQRQIPFVTKFRSGSLLKIDPSGLVSALTKYGNIVLPKSMDHDLKVLERVCLCDLSSVDLINQKLVIENITISLPGEEKDKTRISALRVGKLIVKWNSYRRPCLDIELEDVDILVEFTNLMLTKTNWHELAEIGFPPTMYLTDYYNTTDEQSTSMLRIGNIDVKGNVKIRILSRPLDQIIAPDFVYNLSMLEALTNKIHDQCDKAKADGQIGCTTEELYDILSEHVYSIVKKMLSSTVKDLAKSKLYNQESETVKETKKAFSSAMDTLSSYADKVATMGEQHIQSKLKERLKDWGLSSGQVMGVLKEVTNVIKEDNSDDNPVEYEFDMDLNEFRQKQTQKALEAMRSISDDAIARFLGVNKRSDESTYDSYNEYYDMNAYNSDVEYDSE